jgi:hypothetical protein
MRPAPTRTVAAAPGIVPTVPLIAAPSTAIPTLGAVPRMGRIPAVEGPPEVEDTLRATVEFQRRMEVLVRDQPGSEDMVWTYQRAAELVATVSRQLPQMVPGQRDQALKRVDELVNGIERVFSSYVQLTNEEGPTVAFGTPVTAQGVPLVVIGTPRAIEALNLPTAYDLLAHDIAQAQSRAAELARGQPSTDDLVVLTSSLGSTATSIRQLSGYLTTPDLQRLTADMAGVLQTLAAMMEAHAP